MTTSGILLVRLPLALATIAALAVALGWLQARFVGADVRKGIVLAMRHRPHVEGPSVLDALSARGEGAPRCDGAVVSQFRGHVLVRCATPGRPEVSYRFRVRLDGGRPPTAEGAAAEALVAEMEGAGSPARGEGFGAGSQLGPLQPR